MVTSSDDYAERFRELTDALRGPPLHSRFRYTQLTDTGQETNGLLTAAREHRVPVETIRVIASGESM